MGKDDFSFEQFCKVITEFSPCMDDYPYVYDLQNDRYFISKKALERFAVPKCLFNDVQKTHSQFVYKDDQKVLVDDLSAMIRGEKDEHNMEYRWLDHDQKPVWINCRGRVIKDGLGKPKYMIGCVNEIGLEAKADNVSGFMQSTAIQQALDNALYDPSTGWILRIGIDGFEGINQTYDRDYGNHVIEMVSECIRRCLNDHQSAYHIVSEEYIILDKGGNDTKEEIYELYRRIRREIELEIQKDNYDLVYTISAGIISYQKMGKPGYEDVMKYSEFALGEARKMGKNQFYVFDQEDYDRFLRKRDLLVDMRKSVADNCKGFDLVFQPIMTGGKDDVRLFAAESLLRYTTSTGEHVSPVEFIPILEESGLIIPVGKWIFDRAVCMCSECQKIYPRFKVSINLSYVQILKSQVLNEVLNSIADYGVSPNSIIIEMTESGYLEDTAIVRKMWDRLKKFGFLIAIDDFGTGYSNLSSISQLAPDIIKIDRGFTVKALSNSYEKQLMANIIELVHSIDLKICLEGVETKDDLDTLNRMDPNFIQGYYYSKPCPKEEFKEKFIEK